MKIKELERTANIAWSPEQQYPIYMVAGTAAQQLDATFSTSAALEMYSLNFGEQSLDMPLVATCPSDCRFHKVAWGCYGVSDSLANGVVVGGADNGALLAYNGTQFLNGEDSLMFKKDKHSGAVKALDFNPFQSNLLVSGGAESEIFIWDLNNPDSPMTPGAKSQPPEDVACVSWNRQVQHILASTFSARCVVWDLRKNEPIIKVSDSMSRIKCKLVCWNPAVATQMCISSEDDHTPVIQLWDLRYATSPVKVLENHQRGVLSMAWCPKDPDLLLSCGKDNRILCWNPNSAAPNGEVVYELPTSHQWSFDVQWCPRNPNVISSSSFDGHVTCYSLMGGGHPIHHVDKVSDSFQTNDPFAQAAYNQQQQLQQEQNVMPLQKPPRWLQRPVGANFGFGGRLVSFEKTAASPQQAASTQVLVSQVVTETDLLAGSQLLEQALNNEQHIEFCAMKATNATDSLQESLWNFLMVNFEKEPRERFIQLLGYDKTELAKKVSNHTHSDVSSDSIGAGVDATELAQKMNQLGTGALTPKDLSSSAQGSPNVGSKTPASGDELSFPDQSSQFDDIGLNKAPSAPSKEQQPLQLAAGDNADGLLVEALLLGNFEAAVDVCLADDKMAEAILLAIAGGPELLSRTQKKYFQRINSNLGKLVSAVVTHDWSHIVEACELSDWKEALAIILTYSPAEEFASLCDSLGSRLEAEGSSELAPYAGLCYICSGNVEKLVENWFSSIDNSNSPQALQELVEKVMLLRKAVENSRGQAPDVKTGLLADKLTNYAGLLAAQGCLDTALRYLGNSTEHNITVLRDRLYKALGQTPQGSAATPWKKVDLPAAPVSQPAHQPHQPHQKSYTNVASSSLGTGSIPSPNQYGGQYSNMNGSLSSQPYNTGAAMSASNIATPSVPQPAVKNPVPMVPAPTPTVGYTQPTYNPLDYNQPAQPSQNYYGQYMTPAAQPSGTPANYYPTSTPGGPYPPASSTGSMNQPHQHSFQDYKPDKAWNDPPMVIKKDKSSKPAEPNAAVTPPMYGVPPAGSPHGDAGAPGAPMSNYGNYYNPQEHQPQMNLPAYQTNQVTQAPKAKPVVAEPTPVAPKAPLPSEHQLLEDIFNGLVHNCVSRANNAQMKRKLEDVTKKLELLYDRLREQSLSDSVTQGLHQIVAYVRQNDYNSVLVIISNMVSQGNFSEISTFMPGIKMLIQSASQLQVYVS